MSRPLAAQIPKSEWSDIEELLNLPQELEPIADAIQKSRWMLELEDDWDGEGNPGYSEATWSRAVRFLLRNALSLWQERGVSVSAPAIHNGPEGNIDIYWETSKRSRLINVPAKSDEPASFYGHDAQGKEVKGTLDLSDTNQWLMMWQME
jgi:hypothetical protein